MHFLLCIVVMFFLPNRNGWAQVIFKMGLCSFAHHMEILTNVFLYYFKKRTTHICKLSEQLWCFFTTLILTTRNVKYINNYIFILNLKLKFEIFYYTKKNIWNHTTKIHMKKKIKSQVKFDFTRLFTWFKNCEKSKHVKLFHTTF